MLFYGLLLLLRVWSCCVCERFLLAFILLKDQNNVNSCQHAFFHGSCWKIFSCAFFKQLSVEWDYFNAHSFSFSFQCFMYIIIDTDLTCKTFLIIQKNCWSNKLPSIVSSIRLFENHYSFCVFALSFSYLTSFWQHAIDSSTSINWCWSKTLSIIWFRIALDIFLPNIGSTAFWFIRTSCANKN